MAVLFNIEHGKLPLIKHIQKGFLLEKGVFQRAAKEVDTLKNNDILFFGSSHAYRAFDPKVFKEFGYRSYNLGSSSQTPLNSYFLMKKYIDKCNTVVMEVYPVAFTINGTESFADLIRAEKNYFSLIYHAAAIGELFPFQNISVKPLADKYIEKKKEDFCIYRNGYVEVYDSAGNKNTTYPTVTLSKKMMDKQFNYFNKIITMCNRLNKKLILVYAPVPKQHQMVNEVYFKTKLYAIINKNKIPFIDMSRNLPLSDRNHFYDDDHLNAAGVSIFNHELIKAINPLLKLQHP